MERFARLLDALLFTPARLGKLRLMQDYFGATSDPERGWALAALTGEIAFAAVKPAQIRDLALTRIDAELFQWSYDFVGDLAETVSLIWPERKGAGAVPGLAEIVAALTAATRADAGLILEGWLDLLDATGRWALLKLVTGGLRIGVSARLAKTALAQHFRVPLDEIEAVWHGLAPPYEDLFRWLDGRAPRPETAGRPTFTPLMLAQALEDDDLAKLDPADYRAEWKWDGIRVQLVARGGRRLYSRTGDDVGPAFPEIVSALPEGVVLDGELLVVRGGEVAPFNDLQQHASSPQGRRPRSSCRNFPPGSGSTICWRRRARICGRSLSICAAPGSKPGTRGRRGRISISRRSFRSPGGTTCARCVMARASAASRASC